VLTGFFLTGGIQAGSVSAFAEFENCGQSLREGGDVKLRGVLVGSIGAIERTDEKLCRVEMKLIPEDTEHIPANVHAQIRAKTVFGEKWLEILYPESEEQTRIAEGDVIGVDRTIDPLEVETIFDTGMPLLEAVDPENLAALLDALTTGFKGHEEAARRGIDQGLLALAPFLDNKELFNEGITQLKESGEVFQATDDTLLEALGSLDEVNRWVIENQALIEDNFEKAPRLLREISTVFDEKFSDLKALVNSGATLVGILADRTDDIDKLLHVLPKFNSAWIRNLDHQCRFRQESSEEGRERGDPVPGRCWRVHNIIGHSRGAYAKDPAEDGKRPDKDPDTQDDDDDASRYGTLVVGPDGERYAEVPSSLYMLLALQQQANERAGR
jgi:virulence factor Mce-like protein